MTKVAFIFPGQGSQYVGMGREIAAHFTVAKEIFDTADDALQMDISKLCFEGPEEILSQTVNTQPAILTTSISCYKVLEAAGIIPDQVAGHSLGEHSALVAAGAVQFRDAVQLVRQRGQWMQEAAEGVQGGMAAVLGLSVAEVAQVCKEAANFGIVEAANYNCPGQIVISGENKALEKAAEFAKKAGAKRVIPLAVSGPFHSSLIAKAGVKLKEALDDIALQPLHIPLAANVTADYVSDVAELKDCIVKQVSMPVQWEASIQRMIATGITIFVEVGPGRVLSGLVRKINKNIKYLNVENPASCEKTLDYLKGVL